MGKSTLVVGLDMGNVLSDKTGDYPHEWGRVRRARRSVREMVGMGIRVAVITRADGKKDFGMRFAWLGMQGFFEAGIQPEDVLWCRERIGKGRLAAKLQLDIFVDDRYECLSAVHDRCPEARLFAFDPANKEPERFKQRIHKQLTEVHTWPDLMRHIRRMV